MSYPPHHPNRMPEHTPRNRANLWIIGSAIVVILAIILGVALILTQRSAEYNRADDTGGTTGSASVTGTTEAPTQDPTEDPAGGGSPAGEGAGFTDETCAAFDLVAFAEAFDSPRKTENDHTYADGDEDDYGSLICSFYTENNDDLIINVTAYGSAETTLDALIGDWEANVNSSDHEVTELTDLGDNGYRSVADEGGKLHIEYHFVHGIVDVTILTEADTDEHDLAAVDAMVTGIGEQAIALFDSYA